MAKEPAGPTEDLLRDVQETLAEHGRLLHGLSGRVDELRRGLAKQSKLIEDAVQGTLEGVESSMISAESESLARARPASKIKLDELMAELEKLPPEELRRQIEAANALLLLEEPACQSSS